MGGKEWGKKIFQVHTTPKKLLVQLHFFDQFPVVKREIHCENPNLQRKPKSQECNNKACRMPMQRMTALMVTTENLYLCCG